MFGLKDEGFLRSGSKDEDMANSSNFFFIYVISAIDVLEHVLYRNRIRREILNPEIATHFFDKLTKIAHISSQISQYQHIKA